METKASHRLIHTYLMLPPSSTDPLLLSMTSNTSIPQLPPNMAHKPFEYAPILPLDPLEADLHFGYDIRHRLLLVHNAYPISLLRCFLHHKHPTYKDERLRLQQRFRTSQRWRLSLLFCRGRHAPPVVLSATNINWYLRLWPPLPLPRVCIRVYICSPSRPGPRIPPRRDDEMSVSIGGGRRIRRYGCG